MNKRVRVINRLRTLQYYLCSVFYDESDIVNKSIRVINRSGSFSTIHVVYWMVKLTLWTKGLG